MTMTPHSNIFNHVVAFEVSKTTLVVHCVPGDAQSTIANTPQAVRRLLKSEVKRNARLKIGPLLVVCEATGGYEQAVLDVSASLGLSAHKAHGSRVRSFARYLGLIAKTDTIDARLLAIYGLKTERLRLYVPPSPDERILKELKGRRDEVQAMIIAETNRIEHARCKTVIQCLRAHVAGLQKMFKTLEAEIAGMIRSNTGFARKASLMRSVIGIGPVTAAAVLAYMPELGSLSKGQAARLAGLAPINKDSGRQSAPRHIQAGRAAVRKSLYMAALVAMKANPAMKSFAGNLQARGKNFKIAITAVMRKLIVILNAVLRDGKPCNQQRRA
jgi:transposase